jgi:hypothetical protein
MSRSGNLTAFLELHWLFLPFFCMSYRYLPPYSCEFAQYSPMKKNKNYDSGMAVKFYSADGVNGSAILHFSPSTLVITSEMLVYWLKTYCTYGTVCVICYVQVQYNRTVCPRV